uniref:Ribonuclease P protein component 2 n=1 Tax=Candidatus Methanophaga sp. ANME-1 ERB7 TaxID=2759913 RepID=A0A7G9Z2G8_9EURY|nr:ribonuclease P protein component 2 [Methanosarcinales archaeon ANME-1 ERB7]
MVKAGALKRRYVLFRLEGQRMDEEALKRAIYAEALKFFGEYGLSKAALKLMNYDEKKKLGILRCERSHQDIVLGFLALIGSLSGTPARLVTLKSSGTVKSLESTFLSSQDK